METDIDLLLDNSRERLVGIKQVFRGIINGDVECVLVARNADSFIIDKIVSFADASDVPVLYCDDKVALGRKCDIDVAAAVVGILKK